MHFDNDMTHNTSLNYIKDTISNYTALQYAESRIKSEKSSYSLPILNVASGEIKEADVSYEEYMRETWNSLEDATLEDCIERSRISKLNEYAEMVQLYTGWIRNGKVFVLNKKEKFISFLYNIKRDGGLLSGKPVRVDIYTHYNPLDVDCIEESISPKYLDLKLEDENYILSKDEEYLIKECGLLINA